MKECLNEIKEEIESGCRTDALGGFIEWFSKRNAIYC